MTEPTAPIDMKEWLRGLGMEKYADVFAAQEIEFSVLPELTDADLQNLGIPMGPRKRLLKFIDQLREDDSHLAGGGVPHTRRRVDQPERRQLTVMFCDLVGSTSLSRRLDPEDMRDVIRAYQDLVLQQVARFDGHVAGFAGDSVKVYFGFPAAHENQAERAIRAAMAISDTIGALATPANEPLSVRIGVATGLVVVGDLIGEGAAQEEMVVGETPNLAARLQSLAEPGNTLIAATTRQLVGGLFDLQGLGLQQIKGYNEPVEAWRVLRESRIASRFDALHTANGVPLIGRNTEIALLDERWALARQLKGQVVLLSGEPGIGKSRIAQEFSARIARDAPAVLSYQCWPHFVSSSLHPFIDHLKRDAGTAADDRGDDSMGAPPQPELLPAQEGDEAPSQPREKFFEAFVDYVRKLSKDRAVLFLFEDAHWSDPSSLELLELVIERTADCSVLVLITCRPEFGGISKNRDHVTSLTLNRCDRDAVRAIVDHLAVGKNLSATVRDQIAERTDGVPLFVEELTIAILESGRGDEDAGRVPREVSDVEIPATLYDCLMVRLDRLGPAKKIAQLASAIGREFSYDVIHAISRFERGNLDAALKDLVVAEIVYPLQNSPRSGYTFKHALVQDAAYQSLLAQQRRTIHAKIAEILTETFPAIRDNQPELLAHHFTLAGKIFRRYRIGSLPANVRCACPPISRQAIILIMH